MTLKIIGVVILGMILGLFIPETYYGMTDHMLNIGLCFLLFFVGVDIGKNKDIFKNIKRSGPLFILIPMGVAAGSILGSIILGFALGYPINESGAIGAGFAWYSLSSIIIAPYSSELSVLSFLTNLIREILAIMIIPFVAKHIGFAEAIAPGGATAMDTTLPIVSKNTNAETAILSFTTGLILSMLVPILVPFILNLGIL
ncbi:LysO family transporter [Fusibacter ferrireducens]|uniref:Lysine exporter LysO family protein n=1 Tax=Fusibacter ferrireducens TaxID=2785058 RepID=A0ABR9ZR93_9FIRM|nr:lysine exporter LysO family protein [Fusibacter ferrireducens]MBF4692978.1 lysine exporter LysO family protein [Fusibacter ferrireducens]